MKFLVESTDTPHTSGVRTEKLPLPNPGTDEYRRYWNEHEVTRQQTTESDVEVADGSARTVEVTELTASFVAASCEHEPTIGEWKQCLLEEGYTEDKVNEILGADAEG